MSPGTHTLEGTQSLGKLTLRHLGLCRIWSAALSCRLRWVKGDFLVQLGGRTRICATVATLLTKCHLVSVSGSLFAERTFGETRALRNARMSSHAIGHSLPASLHVMYSEASSSSRQEHILSRLQGFDPSHSLQLRAEGMRIMTSGQGLVRKEVCRVGSALSGTHPCTRRAAKTLTLCR